MKDWLFGAAGREYLLAEYVTAERSTYAIADEKGTYANLVRRALLRHGIPLRDKSAAQRAAVKSGRHASPTAGRERTDEEKANISAGVSGFWASQTP
jgi:hypothetical protein